MAVQVLGKTPEANLSAAVTGYLGPNAPPGKEGLIYVGIAVRQIQGEPLVSVREHRIAGRAIQSESVEPQILRQQQQCSAAHLMVQDVNALLNEN